MDSESAFIFETNIRLALEYILVIRLEIGALEYVLVIRLGIGAISRRKVIRITNCIINVFKLVFCNFFRSN
jgi:hypothetical protein